MCGSRAVRSVETMTTSTLVLAPASPPATSSSRTARVPRKTRIALSDRGAATSVGAAVLSILGSMIAIGVAAMGVLVVPVAALVVFGPALLARF